MEALYIEDDLVQQRLMSLYLAGMDIKLHLADNGTDGLAMAQQVLPSFIITDLFVPGPAPFLLHTPATIPPSNI